MSSMEQDEEIDIAEEGFDSTDSSNRVELSPPGKQQQPHNRPELPYETEEKQEKVLGELFNQTKMVMLRMGFLCSFPGLLIVYRVVWRTHEKGTFEEWIIFTVLQAIMSLFYSYESLVMYLYNTKSLHWTVPMVFGVLQILCGFYLFLALMVVSDDHSKNYGMRTVTSVYIDHRDISMYAIFLQMLKFATFVDNASFLWTLILREPKPNELSVIAFRRQVLIFRIAHGGVLILVVLFSLYYHIPNVSLEIVLMVCGIFVAYLQLKAYFVPAWNSTVALWTSVMFAVLMFRYMYLIIELTANMQ